MKRLLVCLLLVFATSPAFCSPLQNQTPDQSKGENNGKIQDNIESVLEGDPILSGADVEVQVDDQNITLTGTVESYAQHQRVLQLVEPYTRYRKVVDKIKAPASSQPK